MRATTTLVDTRRPPSRSRRSARRGSWRWWPTRDITATRRWSGLRPRRAQLRLGAGSRPAALEGPGGGAGRGVCQPAADRGARGKRLLRQRGELLERPNAHLYETGRMRRVHLRGHPNILKRLLVQVCGQSRVAHAAPDGRGHAAEPPGPRVGAWRRIGLLVLGACAACHDRPDSSVVRRHTNTDTRIDNQPLLPRAASPDYA